MSQRPGGAAIDGRVGRVRRVRWVGLVGLGRVGRRPHLVHDYLDGGLLLLQPLDLLRRAHALRRAVSAAQPLQQ